MANWKAIFRIDFRTLTVSSAALGSGLLSGLFSFYYVKVFLEIYKINQAWLNAAQIFYIVCNTINEPLLGYVQDYGCKPCRSRRRVILFGGPVFAVVFLYPWFNWYSPADCPPWMVGVHLISVLFLWNFMFTLIGSALCGLFAEMSTDNEHRVRLLRYNECAYLLASAAVFPVDKISHSLHEYDNFRYAAVAVSILAALCFLICGLKAPDAIAQVQDRQSVISVPVDDSDVGPLVEDQDTSGIVNSAAPSDEFHESTDHSFIAAMKVVWQVFRDMDFWCAAGGNFMSWLRIQINANFMAIFTECLVSATLLPSGSYSIATFYLLCQIIPRIVIIFSSPLAAKFGSYRIIMASYMLSWLNSAIGLVVGTLYSYNFIIATLLVESILVRFQVLYMVIFSDFIDEDTKKHRRKLPASTLIFTLNGLLVKPTVALGPVIIVALLNIGNYDDYKNDIRNGPPVLKYTMFLTCCCVPAAVSILGFILMSPYRLKDKHKVKKERDIDDNDGCS